MGLNKSRQIIRRDENETDLVQRHGFVLLASTIFGWAGKEALSHIKGIRARVNWEFHAKRV